MAEENKKSGVFPLQSYRQMFEEYTTKNRRRFLALLGATGVEFATSRPTAAQTQFTPDAALEQLLAGNKRYVSGRLARQDLSALRRKTLEKQEPFAAILACADSRVPVETIFDQTIGQIFVVRLAGNIVTPEVIATLEYGAAELGTKAILVLGHSNCGAVKATMQGTPVPGQISVLYQHIQPALSQPGANLGSAIKANAQLQSDLLRKSSTVIAGLLKENKLKVAAGYYDLAGGGVTLLGPSQG